MSALVTKYHIRVGTDPGVLDPFLNPDRIEAAHFMASQAVGGYTRRKSSDPGYDRTYEEVYEDVFCQHCGY